MDKFIKRIFAAAAVVLAATTAAGKIDRRAVVERHNVETAKTNPKSPAQVGNGEFAYNFDITGMQTFVPFNTLAHWAWHIAPEPRGGEDFGGVPFKVKGKTVFLPVDREPLKYPQWRRDFPDFKLSDAQKRRAKWLAQNPSAFNLGRIGLALTRRDGSAAAESDIANARQKLDLFGGIAESSFELDGAKFAVKTLCRQGDDTVAFEITSEAFESGNAKVFFEFPRPNASGYPLYVGSWDKPELHSTKAEIAGNRAEILREIDGQKHFITVVWNGEAEMSVDPENPHKLTLAPSQGKIEVFANFSKSGFAKGGFGFAESAAESRRVWQNYWLSGAAIDLSKTADPRAREIERRAVLSQYLMRINSGGSLPSQESGLLSNSWYGKFHYEMIWWHSVHFGLWGRGEIAQKQWEVFEKYLPQARERAKREGYRGAKWNKATGNIPAEWPHLIHATLIWQQPHPIYFAEEIYRANPSAETLEKWRDTVFETAEFLASYPRKNGGVFELPPPLTPVSENTNPFETKNPTFELSYWRYGLATALKWKERLGEEKPREWLDVLEKLAPLPTENGVYVLHEGVEKMWEKFNFEHPALIGVFGMLRGDGADAKTAKATLAKIRKLWNFDRVWGWDFPMLAMAAARTGDANTAVDFLLYPSKNFEFDEHGVATGGPCPYFPSNGGFLAAVAMLAGGWDGMEEREFSEESRAFPRGWKVEAEGFGRCQ